MKTFFDLIPRIQELYGPPVVPAPMYGPPIPYFQWFTNILLAVFVVVIIPLSIYNRLGNLHKKEEKNVKRDNKRG